MSHYPGGPSPKLTPSAQLLSERGNIDDRPLFHDPPGREPKERHSLDTDSRAVARHTAGGHAVRANHLPVHRDQILVGDRTFYGHLEIRHGRSPGFGRCAVLLEAVVGRGTVRYEIATVDLVEPVETSFSHAFKEDALCGAHIVRTVRTSTGAERDRERDCRQSDRNKTHRGAPGGS